MLKAVSTFGAVSHSLRNVTRRAAFRLAVLSCTSLAAITAAPAPEALAQSANPLLGGPSNPNAQLLLQADELIYDNDNQTITAVGDVRIDYDGTRLVAKRVIYREQSERLIATGDVEILQPDGTRTFAGEIDITDDFRDGFVNSLRVQTADETRFAAESAIRENGTMTTFNNGIYTACNECSQRKGGPPLWQIKAKRVIWNGEEKTIRFERARFEFLGVPIAYVPVFTTADPSVKRKTGFLAPNFRYAEELGFGIRVPYFINLAPHRDVTVAATGYTRQGLLGEARYRERFSNGTVMVKAAGIYQQNPNAFAPTEIDSTVRGRGMIGTTGRFQINPRWAFGWNGLLQTDQNFAKTYSIQDFSSTLFENKIYLTGIGDRSYFDARAIKYDYQTTSFPNTREKELGTVLPSVDYNYTLNNPVAGGELSFDLNMRGNQREMADVRRFTTRPEFATPGVNADSYRFTAQTQWKRTFITRGGLVITPILHAQGDVTTMRDRTIGPLSSTGANLRGTGTSFRGMATAGLEVRYPILFSTSSATHVLEPVAQVFARPNETLFGVLPNEDAHSLVFDGTNLFNRDKFSGFDRIEGGVRANVGLRYTGTFENGWGINAVFGQSYHLAGVNSFAQADTFNAGADSGLETKRSDYVGAVGLSSGAGFNFGVGARFDERNFMLRRADATVDFARGPVSLRAGYAFIGSQPDYGYLNERHQATAGGSLTFAENWSVFGNATYDLRKSMLDGYTLGIGYTCDCFKVRASYTEKRDSSNAITKSYQLFISLRTLGDFGLNSDGFTSN